jgi:lysophospholipase L1-like esterase
MKSNKLVVLLTLLLIINTFISSFAFAGDHSKISLAALGDSITFGYGLEQNMTAPSSKAFPNLIEGNGSVEVTNLGVSGWTSTDLLNALTNDAHFNEALSEANIVTLNIGSNDLLKAIQFYDMINSNAPIKLTPELELKVKLAALRLGEQLKMIVGHVQEKTSSTIILYTLYNPFDESTDPTMSSLHNLGEQIIPVINEQFIKPVSLQSNVVLADAYKAFNGNQNAYILPNDFHPTEQGHQALALLADNALKTLQPEPVEFAGGDGTANNPYLIKTAQQLDNVRNYLDQHFKLAANIDLSSFDAEDNKGWSPIGNDEQAFTGFFDGNRNIISGLTIKRPDEHFVGLFGAVSNGVIQNVSLENVQVSGHSQVGALAGSLHGKIEKSYTTGSVTGLEMVGGLVGNTGGLVSQSYSTSKVDGNVSTGGLIGKAGDGSEIVHAYASGRVTGSSMTGGLIGTIEDAAVTSSYWDVEAAGQANSASGIGKATVEMKEKNTFIDWDFQTVWGINEGESYPFLITYEPLTIGLTAAPHKAGASEVTIEVNVNRFENNLVTKKYALGNVPLEEFTDSEKGSVFNGSSFQVTENGIYTVYIKDDAGNEAINTIEIRTINPYKFTLISNDYTEGKLLELKNGIVSILVNEENFSLMFGSKEMEHLLSENALLLIKNNELEVTIPISNFETFPTEFIFNKKESSKETLSAVYDFKVKQNNQEKISFSKPITLSLQVDPHLINNGSKVKLYTLNEAEKQWTESGGVYKDGILTAEITKAAIFAVFKENEKTVDDIVEEPVKEEPVKEAPDTDKQIEKEEDKLPTSLPENNKQKDLPNTATSMYNMLTTGLTFILLGLMLAFLQNRRFKKSFEV